MRALLLLASLMSGACGSAAAPSAGVSLGPLQKLVASDAGDRDWFGSAIAGRADLALVGAWSRDRVGGVYVIERVGDLWVERQSLAAHDPAQDQHFGHSLALDGEVAFVGAPGDSEAGETAGAAYVLEREGGVWREVQKLVAREPSAGDNFGYSVALDGDLAVVGAFLDDSRAPDAGSVHVFERTADGWREVQELLAADGLAGDWFGQSLRLLAGEGDAAPLLVVGAHHDNHLGENAGSAYVFQRDDHGWSELAKLVAGDSAAGDRFGHMLSLSRGGDGVLRALIGARFNGANGSAYVFESGPDGWFESARLRDPAGEPGDQFGWSVALQGDLALVGAIGDAPQGSGSAHLFRRGPGGWGYVARLAPPDARPDVGFGVSVGLLPADGALPAAILVGAWRESSAATCAGALYALSLGVESP